MLRPLVASVGIALLVACSGQNSSEPEGDGWEACALAGGAVSFSMPYAPDTRSTESGSGEDLITEEIASCDYYADGLGLCHLRASVLSGPGLAKDFGETTAKRRNWAKFLIVGMISGEEGRKIEEEGEWTFGVEAGHWIRIALPENPPTRTMPVFTWMRVCTWGDRAIIQQFVGSQAAFESSMLEPKQRELRERFFSSFTTN